jgi:two-component system OmpR family sensor kinase
VVSGDEPRLRQVLGNLVTNALTHTPVGTPVTVAVARDGASGVLLEVVDHGPGMAPEHSTRAFERFYRADASRTRQTGGNGLGLAIVAAVVAAHGGTVDVETAPGSGAAFRVRLRASTRASANARRDDVDGPAAGDRHGVPGVGQPAIAQ